jgi:hypothetical protein
MLTHASDVIKMININLLRWLYTNIQSATESANDVITRETWVTNILPVSELDKFALTPCQTLNGIPQYNHLQMDLNRLPLTEMGKLQFHQSHIALSQIGADIYSSLSCDIL